MIETPDRTANLEALKTALRRTAARTRATAIRAGVYRLLWQWLALVGVLFVLDLIFALPVWLRWLTLLGQAAFVVESVRRIALLAGSMVYTDEWAARIVEQRHPEVDNALINAVQFERALGGAPDVTAQLMEQEVSRAGRSLDTAAVESAVDRGGERRAARNLAMLGLGWALVGTLFSGGFLAVTPRLFAPWMDDVTPPFSVTKFDVRPQGATVPYGGSLTIAVKLGGQMPDTVALMLKTRNGDWQKVSMDGGDSGDYSLTLDDLRENTWYYVQANTGRSARYLITVTRPPVLQGLQVTYTYPQYTGKASTTETVGTAGIHGLAGTVALLHIDSNRPLAGGQVSVQLDGAPSQSIPLAVDPKSPTKATASLTIVRPGDYVISLQATDGQRSGEAGKGKIVLDSDGRPNVWISSPAQDILVTPTMKVPIQIEAEDDLGVRNIELHRMINDLSDTPKDQPLAAPARRVSDEAVMDLADLGVRPGDRIAYYATAYDNKPGKPNIGETETYTMKVVTPEEFQAALKQERTAADLSDETHDIVGAVQDLADQQKRLADQMDALQKQLAKNPGDKGLQQKLAQARAQQKDLQQRAGKLAQAIKEYSQSPSASPLEAALKQKLAQIAQQIAASQSAMQKAQSGSPAASSAAAKAAAQQLAKANQQMQSQVQASIQHLMEIMPLYNDVNRFMDLLNQQGQLVLKARQFQQSSGDSVEDKAKMDELSSQQAAIASALKQLQQDFKADADRAQEHFPKAAASARAIAAEIDRRKIPGLMQSARGSFQQWNGPQGFEDAQNALQQMQAMVHQAGACKSSGQGELDIQLAQSLGKSGLGSSLGQFGFGNSPGQGMGLGMGSMQSSMPGQSGGSAQSGPKAYQPGTQKIDGTGGDKKMRHANHIGAGPGELAPSDTEVMKNPSQTPQKAGDRSNRYPPEYRKMISDYFKAVAEGR